jgi:ribosomal protein S1
MSEDVQISAPGSIDELTVGMALTATVKRIELFGAFVDIGVGKDALLHISQLGHSNVRNVEDVIKAGDQVTAYILKVDKEQNRIAVSLVQPPALNADEIKEGDVVTGKVVRIEPYGVFVDIGTERPGMVHVSQLADGYVKSPSDVVSVGQEVQVRVLKVTRKKRQAQIDLTMKAPQERYEPIEAEAEVEEAPTAMALAFRMAMKDSGSDYYEEDDEFNRSRRRRDNKRGRRDRYDQDDIIDRTLRQHRGN